MSNREVWFEGVLIERTVNNNDGTGTHTTFDADGNVTSETALTGLPIIPPFDPLDATGALATLLVVEGVLDIDDAANAIHEEPAHLEHEAQAWAL
jgi:hypothetical protein